MVKHQADTTGGFDFLIVEICQHALTCAEDLPCNILIMRIGMMKNQKKSEEYAPDMSVAGSLLGEDIGRIFVTPI